MLRCTIQQPPRRSGELVRESPQWLGWMPLPGQPAQGKLTALPAYKIAQEKHSPSQTPRKGGPSPRQMHLRPPPCSPQRLTAAPVGTGPSQELGSGLLHLLNVYEVRLVIHASWLQCVQQSSATSISLQNRIPWPILGLWSDWHQCLPQDLGCSLGGHSSPPWNLVGE